MAISKAVVEGFFNATRQWSRAQDGVTNVLTALATRLQIRLTGQTGGTTAGRTIHKEDLTVPRPRFAKLDPAKREAILHAALDAFASQGFDSASYNQIIEKAGISKGAMYYYFDDKEDLFATVVRHELEEILEQFHTLPEVHSVEAYWQMLEELMHQAQAFVVSQPKKMMLLRSLMKQRTEGRRNPIIQELYEAGEAFSRQMLTQGQALGAVRRDLPFSLMVRLVTAVDDAGDHWMLEHLELDNPGDLQKYARMYIDLLKRLLQPGSPDTESFFEKED